jgi:hypothetical protein
MTARFEQRLARLELEAEVGAIVCTCPAHPLVVFAGNPQPDIEPCSAHGSVQVIEWPLKRSARLDE